MRYVLPMASKDVRVIVLAESVDWPQAMCSAYAKRIAKPAMHNMVDDVLGASRAVLLMLFIEDEIDERRPCKNQADLGLQARDSAFVGRNSEASAGVLVGETLPFGDPK
jgi:hypothetical protein